MWERLKQWLGRDRKSTRRPVAGAATDMSAEHSRTADPPPVAGAAADAEAGDTSPRPQPGPHTLETLRERELISEDEYQARKSGRKTPERGG
jgi:hypothetical protein